MTCNEALEQRKPKQVDDSSGQAELKIHTAECLNRDWHTIEGDITD